MTSCTEPPIDGTACSTEPGTAAATVLALSCASGPKRTTVCGAAVGAFVTVPTAKPWPLSAAAAVAARPLVPVPLRTSTATSRGATGTACAADDAAGAVVGLGAASPAPCCASAAACPLGAPPA